MDLDAAKAVSLGHLLFRCARRFDEIAVGRVRARTGMDVRTAHTRLFPHLPFDGGIRPTELANRVGISKQAVGKLLDDLVALGVVERAPDPTDGRAQVVRFSEVGRAALLDGLAELARLEAELAEHVGADVVLALKAALRRVDGWLDDVPPPEQFCGA